MAISIRSGDRRDDHLQLGSATHLLPSLLRDGALDAAILLSRPLRSRTARGETGGLPAAHPRSRLAQSAPGRRRFGTGGGSRLRRIAFVQPGARTAAQGGDGRSLAILFPAKPLADDLSDDAVASRKNGEKAETIIAQTRLEPGAPVPFSAHHHQPRHRAVWTDGVGAKPGIRGVRSQHSRASGQARLRAEPAGVYLRAQPLLGRRRVERGGDFLRLAVLIYDLRFMIDDFIQSTDSLAYEPCRTQRENHAIRRSRA